MKKLLYGFLLGTFFLSGITFAQTWISAPDIVAGNNNTVRVSGLYSNENIKIKLIRPDKTIINLQAYADDFGVSSFQVSSINIQQAGKYDVIISRDLGNYPTVDNFTVSPGNVSAYRSELIIDKPSVEADGEQASRLKIIAKDSYGNTIKNSTVKVLSSRNEDSIVVNGKTDEKGQALAKITSKTPGVSTISVLLGDTILFNKKEIVFFVSNSNLKNVGAGFSIGKFLKAQLFDDPEENTNIAYFSIEDLPQEASIGENLTAKIVAKDENGKTIVNYTGTVRFSSSDDRAILPNDYTFSLADQGSHDFYLAITFGTGGEQSLAVHDLDDFRISGEQSLNIALGSEPVEVSEDPLLTIDVPVSGSSFNTARVTISGTSQQCSVVKLVDGQITLIDNLSVDESNKYIYQTPSLADGAHIFQAICVEKPELISNKVSISIDRTPPQVFSVETVPDGPFTPGQNIVVNVDGDDLDAVSCVFNEQIFNFSKNDKGKFAKSLVVPNKEGDYPLECTVSDLLGNSVTEPNAAALSVKNPAKEEPEVPEEPKNIAPTAVTNLSAKSGEKDKVTLFWSPATDDESIKNYQINYAKCSEKNNLSNQNSTPDDRTQWYVTPLNPCETYCFQVIAMDDKGLESAPSNIAEGTPFCPEVEHTAPPKTPKSGANSMLAIIIAILSGLTMIVVSRRMN